MLGLEQGYFRGGTREMEKKKESRVGSQEEIHWSEKMGLKIEHKPVFQAPCNAYPIQFK